MALIHEKSCESVHTGLDLFSIPPTQTAVMEGMWVEYHPLAILSPSAPISFSISGNTQEYIDFANTALHIKAKITNADGSDIANDAGVFPVNYWMHSLFSQVDVTLNDTLVTPSENTYPYRAYIEALINYSREAKQGHLSSALFYRDSANHFEDVQGDENKGMKTRQELTSRSREVDMMGRLHVDFFHQERYMLNGVDVKIKLTPSKSEFNLMGPSPFPDYRSVITHASLFVRKVKLNPAVSLAHAKTLEKGTAKYPLKRVVVRTFSIPRGNLSAIQDNLFLSQTPTRLVIGLVSSAAFNGRSAANPFNFRTFGLTYLSLFLDGKAVPASPLTPQYGDHLSIRAYYGLMSAVGMVNKDQGNFLERRDHALGNTLYAFDLTPSLLDDCNVFELVKTAALRLELKFAEGLPEPVTVILYGEQDSVVEIDRTRQVLTDFSQ